MGTGLLGALFASLGILAASGGSNGAEGGSPRSFFAVRRIGAEVVEVDRNSGRVIATIVDLGPDAEMVSETGGLIDGVDLSADRRTLWFSRYSREPGTVYRMRLPGGTPERVADGHGASVSPDGRQLAFIRQADLVVRDLSSQQDRVFGGVVGELGGVQTAWAGDSRHLAVEILGADVSVVTVLDTETGEMTDLQPVDGTAIDYRVISPAYRPGDGLLSVVCCHTGEIIQGQVPHMTVVPHDPSTGTERNRFRLPFSAPDIDWDPTGSDLLLTDGDHVHRYHRGRFSDIPNINDVFAVSW